MRPQSTTLSPIDKAYAAGFFDGEGSISIEKPRQRRGYTLMVGVGQRDVSPLLWLQSLWGGRIAPMRHNPKGAWKWVCSSAVAGIFLTDILPYLKNKRPVADLALSLQQTKNHALRANAEYLAFCETIRCNVMALNGAS